MPASERPGEEGDSTGSPIPEPGSSDLGPEPRSSESVKPEGSASSPPAGRVTKEQVESWLMHVHRQIGHKPNKVLCEILQRGGCHPEVIALARNLKCDACEAHKKPALHRVVGTYSFKPGQCLEMDGLYWRHPRTKVQAKALMMVDVGSRCCKVSVFEESEPDKKCGNLTIRDAKRGYLRDWAQDRPKPEFVRTDPDGCFKSNEYREMLHSIGVDFATIPAEAHWKLGVCENAIQLIKDTATRIAHDLPSDVPPSEILYLAVAAHNQLYRHDGYSPFMLLLGYEPAAF